MIREMEDNKKLSVTVENRKHPRIEVKWPITLLTRDGILRGETRNLSVEGIVIYTDTPLPIQ